MIGMNWKKSLVVAGVLSVAAAVPALSLAHTPYTGTTPPSIAMMATPVVTPVKKVTTHHGKKILTHHKTARKTTRLARHKVSKKHKKVAV